MPASPYGNSSATPSGYTNRADVISRAVSWAKGIANDDSHKYVMGASHSQTSDGPNYDCTSFVSWAYIHGGLTNLTVSCTSNMKTNFEAAGFTAIPFSSLTVDQLLCGDVLFYHITQNNAHAIMYTGNTNIVHAANSSAGIKEATFYGSSWQWVLRYKAEFASSTDDLSIIGGSPSYPNDLTYISTTDGVIPITSTSGITVYSDVRNSGAPNDRHDMTLREIAYWSDNNTFVTTPTDIKISAINYTTLLGNLYDQFAQYYPNGYTADMSHFTGGIRVVMDFFAEKGMSPAACAGFAASIFELSGIVTNNKGKGICAWEDSYKQDMHQKVEDWDTNLTGQLEYLWQDLCTNYSTELLVINNFPVTDNGARLCANRFIVSYRYKETPQTVEEELHQSENAQARAAEWFRKFIITPTVPYGTSYNAPTSVTIPSFNANMTIPTNGNISGTTISYPTTEVPILAAPGAGVVYSLAECPYPQTGINTAFTSYSSWYNDWNSSSPQYKLAHIWGTQFNRSCDRGIATINGYYLIAVSGTYGTVGTALEVALENGKTFNALIADIKSSGDSNYCPWGHLDSNGRVNVIEWEVVKVQADGRAATTGDRYAGYPPDLTGWQGVNVRYIKNLGKMFDLVWG